MTCPAVVRVSVPGGPAVVRVVTVGPPGIQGPAGTTILADNEDVNVADVVNRSLLRYDAIQGKWIGSPDTTVDETLNGGSF